MHKSNMLSFLVIIVIISYAKLSYSLNCPHSCSCQWIQANLKADCSNLELTEPPDFEEIPIEILDLSNNHLTKFPIELAHMETLTNLDLSKNSISYMEPSSLKGFTSLNILLLNENNISNWRDISPNSVFLSAINLHTLSLAGNSLSSFSSYSEDLILMSSSLKVLDLSHCRITKILGQHTLQGLRSLERLILNGNILRTFTPLVSNSLKFLELNNCSLTKLNPNTFADLRNLISLDLSQNPGLSLSTKSGEYLEAVELKHLDLSYCNMDSIDLTGFPSLTVLSLKGNMIRKLSTNTFLNNMLMEDLDISNNAINEIELGTFTLLKSLKRLNLSYNMIAKIERNIFSGNEVLTTLDLSKNFINKFNKFIVNSLIHLNLSGCEILSVDQNALAGMPKLVELDLSYNLMSHLPSILDSKTLQILDLSMCRLTTIRNTTFHKLPALASLKLSGNRLTTPLRIDYFKGNPYLFQIWLGDNPWRCDCEEQQFLQLFIYITQRPAKINDKTQLKCATPNTVYGHSWERACFQEWYQTNKVSRAERIWSITMISIIIFCVGLCAMISIKRCWDDRKRRRNERELRANIEQQRDIMRQNRIMLQQEAQLNAPDPRETLPPCYEEALLMPRLERGFKSLMDLNDQRRSRGKSTVSKNPENDDLVLDYRRFQSEEVLTVRDRERTLNINTTRRTGRIDLGHSSSRNLAAEESKFPAAYLKSKNLESAEKIANFQSYENSPYSKRRPKLTTPFRRIDIIGNSDSVEIIDSFESVEGSPYTRRQPKMPNVGGTSNSQWTIASDKNRNSTPRNSIHLVEGFYSKPVSSASSSSEFQIMDRNSTESLKTDPPVIVHHQNLTDH